MCNVRGRLECVMCDIVQNVQYTWWAKSMVTVTSLFLSPQQ